MKQVKNKCKQSQSLPVQLLKIFPDPKFLSRVRMAESSCERIMNYLENIQEVNLFNVGNQALSAKNDNINKNNRQKMGCANPVSNDTLQNEDLYQKSPIGRLRIHFQALRVPEEQNSVSKKDVRLRVKLGDQVHVLPDPIVLGNKTQLSLNGYIDFIINSQYRGNGRKLIFEFFYQGLFGENLICSSTFQVNSLILQSNSFGATEENVTFFKGNSELLSLSIGVEFKEKPYHIISFMIARVMLGAQDEEQIQKRKVFVKIHVGEEILKTSSQQQTEDHCPSFQDEPLEFHVPYNLVKEGYMEVFQVINNIITKKGEVKFDLDVLMMDRMQHQYAEQIMDKDMVTGQMKFFTLYDDKGHHHFIEPPSPLKPNNLNLKSPGLFMRRSSKAETLQRRPSRQEEQNPEHNHFNSNHHHEAEKLQLFVQHYPVLKENDEEDIMSPEIKRNKEAEEKSQIKKRLKQPLPPLKVPSIRQRVFEGIQAERKQE